MSASNVEWVRLGEYISQRREKNNNFNVPILGVTRDGFIPPKQDGADTSLYNVFYKNDFVFNPARMELNSIYLNLLYDKAICSSLYEIFYVSKPDELLPEYLNLYIKREEFARFAWYDAIGSARNYFRVSNMQDIKIPLPSIEVQRELVATYNGLKALAEQNEALIEPLSKASEAFIVNCKKQYPIVSLGEYIKRGSKNSDNLISQVLGVGQSGFILPQKQPNESLKNYKIMSKDAICYAPPLYNILSDAIQYYDYETPAVCSPIYEVFYTDKAKLLPRFLFIWLKRKDFKRYAAYYALGVRQTFDFLLMQEVQIPLPPIDVQQSIIDLYKCLEEAKKIAAEAREKMRTLCPALIQKAANA